MLNKNSKKDKARNMQSLVLLVIFILVIMGFLLKRF